MAFTYTQDANSTRFAQSMTYRSPLEQQFLDSDLPGHPTPNPSRWDSAFKNPAHWTESSGWLDNPF
jgi:hypothetical protein